MLNMCHPMELRFLGSFIEDLAKKDFLHLRESEGKANSRNELSNLTLIDENLFRTKMAVFLGLLHSSNRHCSTIIFNLIDNHIQQAFTVRKNMDTMTIHNILLVLSMGMYHPAFTHSQRTRMFEHYRAACEATERTLAPPEPDVFPSLILEESCETRPSDLRLSPACSPHVQTASSQVTQKVYVCDIEVKGSRQRQYHDQRLIEYRIQVTWSNGERKEVYKTVQELLDFLSKLMQSFPEDLSFLKQEKKFPMIHGANNHLEENKEQINIYTRYLSQLPQHIRQCNHMIGFFENGTPVPIPERPSRTSQDAATSPCLQPPPPPDIPRYPHIPIPDIPVGGRLSPAHHELAYNSHSPSLSTKTASPLINSPCQSPESSINDSPVNSRSNSPMLSGLRPEDIEKLSLQNNANIKRKNMLNAREKGNPPLPNGLIDTRFLLDSPPPTHHPYIPTQPGPPLTFPTHHLGAPIYPLFSYHQPPQLSPRMRDMSPTNSECSSPSPSPMPMPRSSHMVPNIPLHLATQQTDSSSEDSDKGKRQIHSKVNGSRKNHYSNSKMNGDEEQRRSDHQEVNSNAGTPPVSKEGKQDGTGPGYGSSGYTSDPTYNARPQMPGPWHKAQPAHTTHIGVRPKHANMINMPELYPKPEIPVQMPIPQHLRDYAAMSAAGHPGLEHFQRPFMYYPGLMNRPQLMNGNRPMYISAPSSHAVNGNLQTQPATSSANKQGFQGHPGGIPPSPSMNGIPQPNVIVNGSDPKGGIDLCAAQRPPLIPNVPTSSSTAVTVTTASSSAQPTPSVATSQHSCTSCGCPGHSSTTTFPYQVPQIGPQNIWPVPFSNGLLPLHLQHAYIPHHPFPPNGLNQDMMFHPQYGLSHPGQQAVGNGIPNLIYGYNMCNIYPNGTNSRKTKKITNCHNCGSSKHSAQDCKESSMETMAGHFHYHDYSYVPKTDSE